MAELKLQKMSLLEAKKWVAGIEEMSEEEFSKQINAWKNHSIEGADQLDQFYVGLRNSVLEAYKRCDGDILPDKSKYSIDVECGLALFGYLSDNDFSVARAADDDVWRYITIRVLPDITFIRYPKAEKAVSETGGRINQKRFFSHTRRIWPKTLWWYVFLSWQGSIEDTRRVIEGNGADIISHFIETPGRGYRIKLYRKIMKRFSESDSRTRYDFNAMMKLNNAECRNIEPELLPNGVSEYCDFLFAKMGGGEPDHESV